MALPLVSWNPGGGTTSVQFVRGPVGFEPRWATVFNDNVADSGKVRERVVRRKDIVIGFTMPAMIVDDDMPGWETFMTWALGGGTFKFYPNAALSDFYNCAEESGVWEPKRVGPKVYAASFLFRVLLDSQAPSSPGVILRRFMGVATP